MLRVLGLEPDVSLTKDEYDSVKFVDNLEVQPPSDEFKWHDTSRSPDLYDEKSHTMAEASLLFSESNRPLAKKLLSQAIELNPYLTIGYYNLGKLSSLDGDDNYALEMFEKALSLTPDHGDITFSLSGILIRMGKNDKALELLEKLESTQKHDHAIIFNKGVALANLDHDEEAVDCFVEASQLKKDVKYFYALQESLAKLKRYDEAIETINQILNINPSDEDAYIALGYYNAVQSKLKESIDAYKVAYDINPNSFDANANLGMLLFHTEDYDGAIFHGQKALTLNPLYHVYINLAKAYSSKGEIDNVITYLEQATEMNPNEPDAWVELGSLYMSMKMPKEALTYFLKALPSPNIISVQYGLGRCYMELDEKEKALPYLQRALELHMDLVPTILKEELTGPFRPAIIQNLITQTLTELKVKGIEGQLIQVLVNIGSLFSSLDLKAKAILIYNSLLTFDPKNVVVHQNLANAYESMEKFSLALRHLTQILEIDPDRYDVYIQTGDVALRLENYDIAERCFSVAVQKNEKSPEAQCSLGDFYYKKNEYEKSMACYNKAIALDPQNIRPHLSIAFCCFELKQYKDAIASIYAAIDINPKVALTWFNLSQAFLKTSEVDRAILALEKSLELDPQYIDSHKELCQIYIAQGNNQKALHHAIQAINIDPDVLKELPTKVQKMI